MGIVSADFGGRHLRRRLIWWTALAIVVLAFFYVLPRLTYLYTEWLWFSQDVRYPQVFSTVLWTKIELGLAFGIVFLALVLGNVWLARRLARRTAWYDEERALRQRIAEVMEYFAERYLSIALLVVALLAAYGVATAAAQKWPEYLLFRHPGRFGLTDPVFKHDIGFYVFRLPFWQYLWQWSYLALIAVFVASAATHYLDKAIRALRGMPVLAPHVKAHLSVLLGLILGVKALGYRLESYHLLYSTRSDNFSGASYTDLHAQLLAYNVLLVVALGCAALALINIRLRGVWLPLAGIGFLAVTSLLLNVAYPALVQRFQVAPNEFNREERYIARSIEYTRRGYGIHQGQMESRQLTHVPMLTMDRVKDHLSTVENVRLWDYRPLLTTYQKQQELQQYYSFYSVDIDRYLIDGRYRQVMLAARELDEDQLPVKTWQNRHIFYTHGYGLVMSPVTDVIESGLPNLVVRDIPPKSSFGLKVTRPGIYYGELTQGYVIVGTTAEENDHPVIEANTIAKTRYSGKGGISLGSPVTRAAAAVRFNELNILISGLVRKQSKILWGREVGERARHIAPFLSFDRDPYVVVGDDGCVYWIQDAYTISGLYPYSERYVTPAGGQFNYVRNSVKVVTDAYDGTVDFYVADPTDPIIQVYQRIFPKLFKPLEDMPAGLLKHIRYPEALFNTQSAMLTRYHVTDPQVFYSGSEKWQVGREARKTVGATGDGSAQGGDEAMQAYYAIVNLPDKEAPEFLLMLPFTPRGKQNMVAWLAGRCDGKSYGKMVLYEFPKTEQVWGPIQIEAAINQEAEISRDMTLLNQQGSSLIRGNLLVLPLGNSILYVEPFFLSGSTGAIPELNFVVVAGGDGSVARGPTLSQALANLLGEAPPALVSEQPGAPAQPGAAGPPPSGPPPSGVTRVPVGASEEVRALAAQADAEFKKALDCQQKGDWAGYGKALQELEKTLQELAAKTKARAPSAHELGSRPPARASE